MHMHYNSSYIIYLRAVRLLRRIFFMNTIPPPSEPAKNRQCSFPAVKCVVCVNATLMITPDLFKYDFDYVEMYAQ